MRCPERCLPIVEAPTCAPVCLHRCLTSTAIWPCSVHSTLYTLLVHCVIVSGVCEVCQAFAACTATQQGGCVACLGAVWALHCLHGRGKCVKRGLLPSVVCTHTMSQPCMCQGGMQASEAECAGTAQPHSASATQIRHVWACGCRPVSVLYHSQGGCSC